MKTLKSNLKLISLCLHGSKMWVVCTFLNILINPIRNMMIDVLLIGTIYNMIGQAKSFKSIIPFFAIMIIFYLVTIFAEKQC